MRNCFLSKTEIPNTIIRISELTEQVTGNVTEMSGIMLRKYIYVTTFRKKLYFLNILVPFSRMFIVQKSLT